MMILANCDALLCCTERDMSRFDLLVYPSMALLGVAVKHGEQGSRQFLVLEQDVLRLLPAVHARGTRAQKLRELCA